MRRCTPSQDPSLEDEREFSTKQWLRSQSSNATLQPLNKNIISPVFPDDDGIVADAEEDFDDIDSHPSTPSQTPPPYPLAHYSPTSPTASRSLSLSHLEPHPEADIDCEPTPPLTNGTITTSAPGSIYEDRSSLRSFFRTSLASLSPSTRTAPSSVLSLVSQFSSCTSSCGEEDEEETRNTRQSILDKLKETLPRPRYSQSSFPSSSSPSQSSPSSSRHPPKLPSTPQRLIEMDASGTVRRRKRRTVLGEVISPKQKRLIVRGVRVDDWAAVEGLGRWASVSAILLWHMPLLNVSFLGIGRS